MRIAEGRYKYFVHGVFGAGAALLGSSSVMNEILLLESRSKIIPMRESPSTTGTLYAKLPAYMGSDRGHVDPPSVEIHA